MKNAEHETKNDRVKLLSLKRKTTVRWIVESTEWVGSEIQQLLGIFQIPLSQCANFFFLIDYSKLWIYNRNKKPWRVNF